MDIWLVGIVTAAALWLYPCELYASTDIPLRYRGSSLGRGLSSGTGGNLGVDDRSSESHQICRYLFILATFKFGIHVSTVPIKIALSQNAFRIPDLININNKTKSINNYSI